jgi:VanZ family protein
MFNRLCAVAAWATLAFIAYATLSPIQHRPTLETSSTFEHLAAFAALGTLFRLAYPRHPLFTSLTVGGSAVLLEFGQMLIPDRHARLEDLVEKLAGAFIGLAMASLLNWIFARRSHSDQQQG